MYRVTNNTIFRNSLTDIQATAEAFARAQQQVSSGRRIQQASDDPSAAATGLRERAEIRATDRYRDANDSVDSRLRVADSVLSDIISSITTAQSKAAQGRTTILTPQQREAVALEIEGTKEAIFTAINTSYRGIYLFAGADTSAAPYTKAGSVVSAYQGDATVVKVDVSRTSSAAVTVDGGSLLQGGPGDVFQTLDALAAAVRAGNMAGVDAGLVDLQGVFDNVTTSQGRVGATLSALPAEKLRLDELRRASDTRRSQAEEISLAEAISEMTRAQQAQQAAIAAAGQNQKRSLMDYL
ncbi:flagellar hook-associated protein FlgL [Luteitalea sp.]|jgi:flagellar hook-associated protein 3 FlgL|uniref:flagellar hook-associated protein FlgL n=1 Tax=Luteitalea sp. TaxID=2004800 RepID=UPI0037C8812E